jgi:LMBR1 domain-containing protein 1
MALVQEALIWIAYAVAVVLLMFVAAIFTFTYQKPGDRSAAISTVVIITLTALLATVLLLPVDIALVSSTTSSKLGRRKDWATPEKVDSILLILKIVYYTLYSFDALLCLIVVPFSYFLYEEYDDAEADEGTQTFGKRVWGAFKYTAAFILLVIILFLVGFFVPVARDSKHSNLDLDYFKRLLSENRKFTRTLSAPLLWD